MRFYTRQHLHYCGIDLHARSLYLCILDQKGQTLVHRKLPCERELLLKALSPYRKDLVVAVECLFCWYWVADLCNEQGFEFVLGHALYMKAIHGGKTKNDRLDSYKIAALLRGGNLPYAYVYPRQMRATRDLLRRRLFFARKRGELLAHIQTPTPSTTCRLSTSGLARPRTAAPSSSTSTTTRSRCPSPPTWLCSTATTRSSGTWSST